MMIDITYAGAGEFAQPDYLTPEDSSTTVDKLTRVDSVKLPETEDEEQARKYRMSLEDVHGGNLKAPPVDSKPPENTDWDEVAKTKQEAIDKEAEKFEANQKVVIPDDTLLKAAVKGKEKGYTAKQTEQLLRSKGFKVADGAIRDNLLAVGLKNNKTTEVAEAFGIPMDDAGKWTRAGQEIIKVGAEAMAGVTSLTNEGDLNEMFKGVATDMMEKETAWKNENSILGADGKIERPWNVAGGVGEAGVYTLVGAMSGGMATMPNAAMKTAALIDFITASTLDTSRYLGSKEFDNTALVTSIGANLLGFGVAYKMLGGKKLPDDAVKAFSNATIEQKAFSFEFYNWAKERDINLLGSDMDEFDSTFGMFLEEAKKNFTTASVLADELKGNMKSMVHVVDDIMGKMDKAKELTPNMAHNIKQSILNRETELDNQIDQAYKELRDTDAGNVRVPGEVILDDYIKSDTYKDLANTPAGRKAISEAEKLALDMDRNYTPSDIYSLIKSVNKLAYGTTDETLSKAYLQLSGYLDDRMVKLAELGGDKDFIANLNTAKSLFKEQGAMFGFGKSRKGADVPNIAKILKEEDPEKIVKLAMSNAETLKALDAHLPAEVKKDFQDFVLGNILEKNTKRGGISEASRVDFAGLAKDIEAMDVRAMKQLFGDEKTLQLKFISTASEILGKQYNTDIAGGNLLGAMAEKQRLASAFSSTVDFVKWATRIFASRKGAKTAIEIDKGKLASAMEGLKKELDEAGIKDTKGIISKFEESLDKVTKVEKTPIEKEDFGPIDDITIKDSFDGESSLKLQKQAEKLKLTVDSSDTASRTAKSNLDKANDTTIRIQNALDRAYEEGDDEVIAGLSQRLKQHEEVTLRVAEQRYDLARRKHSVAKEEYDRFAKRYSSYFENSGPYESGMKGAARPKKTNHGKGDAPTSASNVGTKPAGWKEGTSFVKSPVDMTTAFPAMTETKLSS